MNKLHVFDNNENKGIKETHVTGTVTEMKYTATLAKRHTGTPRK